MDRSFVASIRSVSLVRLQSSSSSFMRLSPAWYVCRQVLPAQPGIGWRGPDRMFRLAFVQAIITRPWKDLVFHNSHGLRTIDIA